MTPDGFVVRGVALEAIYREIEMSGLKRIAKIDGDEAMLTELKDAGLAHDAHLKDGNLVVTETDEHHHKKEKVITCFA